MQLLVERAHFGPQARHLFAELLRAHVVLARPDLAHVLEAELVGSLVGELDHALVHRAHRRRDRVPAAPRFEQEIPVTLAREDRAEVLERETLRGFFLSETLELRRAVLP